ncbi:MAG TPA: long-chain fatty acid--CoA ligase [Gemmatimonadaceae bacterium]
MAATAVSQHLAGERARIRPETLTQLFFEAAEQHDRPDALLVKSGGAYQPISHRTLLQRVRRTGLGLRALGLPPGARVSILSENRPEWAIADYACLTAGYIDVPLYPTLPAEQMAYILRDAGVVAVFVSTVQHARTIASIRRGLEQIQWVIGLDPDTAEHVDLTLAALEAKGAATETPEVAARYREDALRVRPDDLATIIYTSGTTGEPKGAMLTHGNIASNVAAVTNAIPFEPTDTSLSFLPLSHILERMFDFLMFAVGVSIAYVESMDTILANFAEVRPTIVVSVPRIYEKIYARVLENALAGGAVRKRIFFWARAVGERWAEARLAGRTPGALLDVQYAIARRLVFEKLRERVGGRLRYFVSGGAPLAPEINKFFYSAGLVILEGYGLTETSPVIAVNTPEHFRIGTVGRPIPGIEVQIAQDGEILTRGPHVMKGYYNKPEATREAIDADGWMHTGDIGELDGGYLRITDRKKDIIVTAGGKNIAPQPIENQIKTNKYVSQAVMIGDKRRFPVVLVVPNFEQLEKWAKLKNLLYTDRRQLLAQPMVQAKMNKEVLQKLHGLASFETPKKVGLLENDFTIESGELTPTLKVRRRIVDRKYAALIDGLYSE